MTASGRGRSVLTAVLAVAVVAAGTVDRSVPNAAARTVTRPNIVLIVVDDMRYDELENMPNVRALLQDRGFTFDQAIVSNSLCCPSRATILSGRFSDSTGVWTNVDPDGGWARFRDDEPAALPVWLDRAGYETGLVGKYLNGYGERGSPAVPGWDRFVTFRALPEGEGSSRGHYYGYTLLVDGREEAHGDGPADYSTDVLGEHARDFIAAATAPFFLYFAPSAPHEPFLPAPGDEGTRLAVSALPPNVNEQDVSDKPAYVRAQRWKLRSVRAWMRIKEKQERTLLAVDRWVGALVVAVTARSELADTVFVFTSDNGLALGSHRWGTKQVPYDEASRVPLLFRYDAGGWSGQSGILVSNADLAPTLAAAAGVSPSEPPQGVSLIPALTGEPGPLHDAIVLEHAEDPAAGEGRSPPSYCGVRTDGLLFVRYATGEEELYDWTDPFQLDNRAADPAYASTLADLRARATQLCRPVPPGFAW